MTQQSDASGRIVIPWIRVADGLWIGDVVRPFRDEFDHVVTINPAAPGSENHVRHLHLKPPPDPGGSPEFVDGLLPWLRARWFMGRSLLIQSPRCEWSELVVAALFIDMGATADEAIVSLRRAKPDALSPVAVGQLKSREVRHA